MNWQHREKILAATAGGLLLLATVWFLAFSGDDRSAAQLRAAREQHRIDLAAKQDLLDAADRDRRRLVQWQRRSLPSEPNVAESLYRHWLTSLAGGANFRRVSVESMGRETRRGAYTRLSFKLQAHAGLGDVTKFLYDFYAAGHLHQIRQMDLKPLENSRDLEVGMTIDALSLPEATRKDKLSEEPGEGLKLAKLEDYRDPIVKRNLFAPYAPSAPAKTGNNVDPAQHAFVTGFTAVNDARQVWLQDRTSGKTWQLSEGESFQIGPLRGTVRSIVSTREVVIELDGRLRRLRDGDNLRGGVELPQPEKTGETDKKPPVSADGDPKGQAAQELPPQAKSP